jgi:hypothetical protein
MDIIIGTIILFVAVCLVVILAIWGHISIEKIARGGYRSARETVKDITIAGKNTPK